MNNKKIIIALDSDNFKDITNLVKLLKEEAFAFKIGYQFFFNFGLVGYNLIKQQNIKIFLDLKLHDIPNTVENGIKIISSNLKPYFTTKVKGTGLGLAIVNKIINDHDGKINFKPKQDGARVEIILPKNVS